MSLYESLPISQSFYLSYFTEHQECNCKVITGGKKIVPRVLKVIIIYCWIDHLENPDLFQKEERILMYSIFLLNDSVVVTG